MRDAVDEFGQTIVMVTHDPTAAAYADRVVFLGRRPDRRTRCASRRPTSHRPMKQIGRLTMIGKITRKSMRARWGRDVFIGLAIMLGVSFVAGSFVLADSLSATFDNLFSELTENVDLEVRAALTVDDIQAVRDPVPASLADDDRSRSTGVADRRAVAAAGSPSCSTRTASRSRRKAHRRSACRGPDPAASPASRSRTASHPTGPVRWRSTRPPPTTHDFEVGDDIDDRVRHRHRRRSTIVGLVGLGNADGFGGATLAMFDPDDRAAGARRRRHVRRDRHQRRRRRRPRHRAGGDRGHPSAAHRGRHRRAGRRGGGRRRSTSSSRSSATACSIFAFITAFVSAFIINNVFGITISQRLRELALLRARRSQHEAGSAPDRGSRR